MNVYSYLDQENVSHPVEAGSDFTTVVQRIETPESAFALGAPIGSFVRCIVGHRWADLDGYDDELLGRWGITRAIEPDLLRGLPAEVPMYKVKNKLIDLELDDDVEALLGGMPGAEGKKARNLWTSAPNFIPTSNLGQTFKASLGLSDAQFETCCWEALESIP